MKKKQNTLFLLKKRASSYVCPANTTRAVRLNSNKPDVTTITVI
jgi:hypothetical protein